jgi:Rieske Fe-S protein
MPAVPDSATLDVPTRGGSRPDADEPASGPDTADTRTVSPVNRRGVLHSAAIVGVAASAGLALAACGSSDSDSYSAPAAPAGSATGGATAEGTGSGTAGGAANTPSGTSLGSTSDVPVGGGKIFSDANVVVTQPTAGTFKAFSTTCTHQGCKVSKVESGRIKCPCHGSQYSIADGSVQAGPAPRPLPAATVTVSGTNLVLGT